MVTLYSFGPGFGVMDASPFVVKVDLYLRIAKLEYDVKAGTKYLKASPKGKLPFIKDDNQNIGDSSFIIEYLDKKYDVNMDAFLTAEQKAMAHLFTKSVEESLYWCLVYSRWADDTVWEISKAKFFAGVPFLVKGLASSLIRKKVVKNLYGQGISRHSHQEVLSIADQTLNALSNVLGDKDYFFGDKISSFDATAYSVLCQFLVVDYDSDFNQLAKKYDNLDAFCQRIKTLYYP
jgi:glutathione S-transferase